MAEPTLTVLGVYRPHIPEAVYREQWAVTASDELTNAHFEKLVLIEAVVQHAEGIFKAGDLGQQHEGNRSFQCAWDEALLSLDGEQLVNREMDCIEGTGPLRFAFYLHFYDEARPLAWSAGTVKCPPVEPVPDRLSRLVPYNPCT